jgi:hypothetical protein
MNNSMKNIKYIDGPDDIMRFMSIFNELDISLYVKKGFYYDDLKNEPFFVTYIPLGFERYIRIHRDFNDSSVHPSQGRGFCGFDIRSMTSVELPVIHHDDVFREIIYLLNEHACRPREQQIEVTIGDNVYMAGDDYTTNYKRIYEEWKLHNRE